MRSLVPGIVTLLLAASLALSWASCGENAQEPRRPAAPEVADSTFRAPEAPPGRRLFSVTSARLDGPAALPLQIVASGADTAGASIDLIEIHRYVSPREGYRVMLRDTLGGADAPDVQDVTGDGVDDLVVPLRQRGNDPITSNGLHVYSAHGGEVRRVFRSHWMNPLLDTLDGYQGRTIVTSRELWPLFASHAEAETYIEDIYAYDDGRYRSISRDVPEFYRSRAEEQLRRYRAVRDTLRASGVAEDSAGYPVQVALFRSSALVLVNLSKAGDRRGARRFWSGEQEFLRRALEEAQFDELDELAAHLTSF